MPVMTECPSWRGREWPGGFWWSIAARVGRGWTRPALSGTRGNSPGARRSWTASARTPSTIPTPAFGKFGDILRLKFIVHSTMYFKVVHERWTERLLSVWGWWKFRGILWPRLWSLAVDKSGSEFGGGPAYWRKEHPGRSCQVPGSRLSEVQLWYLRCTWAQPQLHNNPYPLYFQPIYKPMKNNSTNTNIIINNIHLSP